VSSCTGTLDTSTPFGPHSFFGEALDIMMNDAGNFATQYFPWLMVNFHFGIQIIDIDVSWVSRESF
jgi:hypothetical protein